MKSYNLAINVNVWQAVGETEASSSEVCSVWFVEGLRADPRGRRAPGVVARGRTYQVFYH